MSVVTPYFLSLERAADLACTISETLAKHPGARVSYQDDKYEKEILKGLSKLEADISGREHQEAEQPLHAEFSAPQSYVH